MAVTETFWQAQQQQLVKMGGQMGAKPKLQAQHLHHTAIHQFLTCMVRTVKLDKMEAMQIVKTLQ
jgi:hypothetical protein